MATVVRVQGSAYRRPGARMLLTASGRAAGMISGGCLEGDVRERARLVMESGKPSLVTYDSTAAEDIVFGLGLGCNGIVQVLIEPLVAGDEAGFGSFLTECLEQRFAGKVATVFHTAGAADAVAPGMRTLHWPDGCVTTTLQNSPISAALSRAMNDAPDCAFTVQRIEWSQGGHIDMLIETLAPPVALVIFGGGDDAIPVVQFANHLGWNVTVVDARPAYALPERFPSAEAVLCLRPEALRDCQQFVLPPCALAMIMTHSYLQDKELLQFLLPLAPRYLGLLGPKKRTQRLLDELEAEGLRVTDEALARLHGPAGLDIGAETPDEIALSLLAEMQSVLANRSGGPLRQSSSGIHAASGR